MKKLIAMSLLAATIVTTPPTYVYADWWDCSVSFDWFCWIFAADPNYDNSRSGGGDW